MIQHLHIVSFDVPYPADYGGVINVFNTIRSLHQLGVAVHLHCFEYGRGEQDELKKYCNEIHYYRRSEGHKGFSLKFPYIVSSRNDRRLWERLNADDYPVLLEGIHCTYGLATGLLKKKNVFIRLHNVEHDYYRQQAMMEKDITRKSYLFIESLLLKKYERQIARKYPVIALSEADANTYSKQLHAADVHYIPPFVSWQMLTAPVEPGSFGLYIGNLSVAENERAASWLLEEVFGDLDIPLVVAGKNPSKELIHLAHRKQHTCIVENPGEKDLQELIAKAQFCIIPSMTDTGIKLKLINALFCGKHVLTNHKMVKGTGLESLCHIADTPKEMKGLAEEVFRMPYTDADKQQRMGLLYRKFNNLENAKNLMDIISSRSR